MSNTPQEIISGIILEVTVQQGTPLPLARDGLDCYFSFLFFLFHGNCFFFYYVLCGGDDDGE